jgi:PAS domain S-box-containing protein
MLISRKPATAVCLALTQAIGRTRTVQGIYGAALDALQENIGVHRASILLFDPHGVMRFAASRGLSERYQHAVEGHCPWNVDAVEPQSIVVPDVTEEPALASLLPSIVEEGIRAMTFVPLMTSGRLIGKFMLYYDERHEVSADALRIAELIATQVAFALDRTRAEQQAIESERRLRFALDAAMMGTWDWDITANTVRWSENLERIHGLPPGTFDGSFGSYEREIHEDDRERVLASAHRAISEGTPHEVEYRIVAPDGTVRWVEGKGRVEYEDGRPVRMTGVCMIVTQRKEAEQARLASAQEAARLKDEFLATLSHELRTPLNAILGWVQVIQHEDLAPDRIRRAVDIIGRNARLQAQLIEDMLDVSGIVTGKLQVDRTPIAVPQLVETAVAGVLPQATEKDITLSKIVQDGLLPIEGDQKRLLQVLGNLLSNAIKFTPREGRISVRVASDDGHVVIEVADTGVGIATEFLPYVFDRFRQADSRTTRSHGGLGLGLAIARHIVEQHNGSIEALSEGTGRGATMVVRLPAEQLPVFAPEPREAPQPSIATSLDGCTVLVVDDEKDSRELLAEIFGRCGASVKPCAGADEALSVLASCPVSLIVADIAMPGIDGYDFIQQVRRSMRSIPAVAVSAYARPEDRHKALAAGFNAYCGKPVDTSELLGTIRGVLSCS